MPKEDGYFKKGNEIGKATRFKSGNKISAKYDPDYCDQMLEYFREEVYPTVELFAETLGVVPSTLYNWCEKHPRFGDAFSRCMNIQKGKMIEGGMKGLFNPQIVKFVAVNCHGMSEKSVNDTTITYKVEVDRTIDEESN
jgi:hypothetical protein